MALIGTNVDGLARGCFGVESPAIATYTDRVTEGDAPNATVGKRGVEMAFVTWGAGSATAFVAASEG